MSDTISFRIPDAFSQYIKTNPEGISSYIRAAVFEKIIKDYEINEINDFIKKYTTEMEDSEWIYYGIEIASNNISNSDVEKKYFVENLEANYPNTDKKWFEIIFDDLIKVQEWFWNNNDYQLFYDWLDSILYTKGYFSEEYEKRKKLLNSLEEDQFRNLINFFSVRITTPRTKLERRYTDERGIIETFKNMNKDPSNEISFLIQNKILYKSFYESNRYRKINLTLPKISFQAIYDDLNERAEFYYNRYYNYFNKNEIKNVLKTLGIYKLEKSFEYNRIVNNIEEYENLIQLDYVQDLLQKGIISISFSQGASRTRTSEDKYILVLSPLAQKAFEKRIVEEYIMKEMDNRPIIIIPADTTTKSGTDMEEAFEYISMKKILDWGTDAPIRENILEIIRNKSTIGYIYSIKNNEHEDCGTINYRFKIIDVVEEGIYRPEQWKNDESYKRYFRISDLERIKPIDPQYFRKYDDKDETLNIEGIQRPVYGYDPKVMD